MCENSRSVARFGSFLFRFVFLLLFRRMVFCLKCPIVFLKRFGGERCRNRVSLPAAFPLFPEKGVRKRLENVGRQTRGENKNSSALCRNVHERWVLCRETSCFCREPRGWLPEGASRGRGFQHGISDVVFVLRASCRFTFLPKVIAFAFLFIAGFSARRRPDG